MTSTIPQLAARLTEAQRRYLEAVACSKEPYTARHGDTANWALRHGYTDTFCRLKDGRKGMWKSWSADDRAGTGIAEIGGQRLTPLGLQVRTAILGEPHG